MRLYHIRKLLKLTQITRMLILAWQVAIKNNRNTNFVFRITINSQSKTIFYNQYFFRFNPTYADGIYNKGDILVLLNRMDEAIACMTKAIELRPEWPLYYCNRGKTYIKMNKQRLVI